MSIFQYRHTLNDVIQCPYFYKTSAIRMKELEAAERLRGQLRAQRVPEPWGPRSSPQPSHPARQLRGSDQHGPRVTRWGKHGVLTLAEEGTLSRGFPGAGGCAGSCAIQPGTLWFPTAEGSVNCVCTAGNRGWFKTTGVFSRLVSSWCGVVKYL